MSTPIYELTDRLDSPPFNQDFYTNTEWIIRSLLVLSRELAEKFYFNIDINPRFVKIENVNRFVGYRVDYDLYGLHRRDRFVGKSISEVKMSKHRILRERTGRTWNDLTNKISGLPQKYKDLWFKKDSERPYSKSDSSENVTVLRRIPNKEIKDLSNKEIQEAYLFRFTLDGLMTIYSSDFGKVLKFAAEALDTIVYNVYRKIHPMRLRERYKIPFSCPPKVKGILEEAIECRLNFHNRAAVVLARSALEEILATKYREITGEEPLTNPKCPKCKKPMGEPRPMSIKTLYKWWKKQKLIPKTYGQFGYPISDLGAAGAHALQDVTPDEADVAIKMVLILLKRMKI